MAQQKKDDILFPVNKKGKHVSRFQNFLRCTAIPLIRLVFPCKFYGNKKVPDGAAVYIGNHYRVFDIMYPGMTTWEGIHFLAKKSLSDGKIFGIFCRWCKVIAVNRDGNDVRGIMSALKCLKAGDKVSIYPEGTRNKTEQEMLPFFSGASMFAIRARVPVIPVTLYKKQRPFRMTHVLVGEPFELKEYYGMKLTEETLREADDKLKEALLTLRREHEAMLKEGKSKCKS